LEHNNKTWVQLKIMKKETKIKKETSLTRDISILLCIIVLWIIISIPIFYVLLFIIPTTQFLASFIIFIAVLSQINRIIKKQKSHQSKID